MKIVLFSTKYFSFSPDNLKKIKSLADAEVIESDKEDLKKHLEDADVLITNNYSINTEWFKKAKKLKYVHALSAGVEKILKTLPENLMLANARGVHGINIAEHILGFMLMHERKLNQTARAQLKREWKTFPENEVPGELFGKTAAVFGLGKIGTRTAQVCRGLGMTVLGVNRTPKQNEFAEEVFSPDHCKDAFRKADYVIAAMPDTKETKRFFDKSKFDLMKPTAFFINVGRGSQVNEKDIIECLKNKTIAGAGLDVFEIEPLPEDSELWSLENVIITPHCAGLTPSYMDRFTDVFCENLKSFIEGKPLPNLVDRAKGY